MAGALYVPPHLVCKFERQLDDFRLQAILSRTVPGTLTRHSDTQKNAKPGSGHDWDLGHEVAVVLVSACCLCCVLVVLVVI